MKSFIRFLTLFILLGSAAGVQAQTDTLRVVTSAECNSCKKRLEHEMSFVKGVKKVTLDVKSKVLTVLYNPQKSNPADLRKAITLIGYDADSLPANKKAYDHLPDCCKKGGHSE
ncbi:MAG: cation transporter [Bacteroidia bacterium]|nr:cation transporter [Bacteroidia bacterium]